MLAIAAVLSSVAFLELYYRFQEQTMDMNRIAARVNRQEMKIAELKMATVSETPTPTPAVKTETAVPIGPLSYGSLGPDISVVIDQVDFAVKSADLLGNAQECGSKKTKAYFDSLEAKFKGAKALRYTFSYLKPSQDGPFTILVVPNLPAYPSIGGFRDDFNLCSAGGDRYPSDMSARNLVFMNACGTGYDDSSGRPHGCDIAREKVTSNLKVE